MTRISADRIAQIEARRDELQALMATGDLPSDRFVAVSKEYAELEPVARAAGEVRRLRAEAESLLHMTHDADDELRHMVHADPAKWDEFVKAYGRELKQEPARTALADLRKLPRSRPVTLLYAARDETHNNAVALKRLLARAK